MNKIHENHFVDEKSNVFVTKSEISLFSFSVIKGCLIREP